MSPFENFSLALKVRRHVALARPVARKYVCWQNGRENARRFPTTVITNIGSLISRASQKVRRFRSVKFSWNIGHVCPSSHCFETTHAHVFACLMARAALCGAQILLATHITSCGSQSRAMDQTSLTCSLILSSQWRPSAPDIA